MTRAHLVVVVLAAAVTCACASRAANDPTRARELRARANATYDQKGYPGCAALFAEAARTDARHADDDHYGAACCFALAGDRERAFAALDAAVDAGFRNLGNLEADEDLASLRGDARWAALTARVKAGRDHALRDANPELRQMFDDDQAARRVAYEKIDWSVVSKKDAEHRRRVSEILAADGARVSLDYYHAAMVFQHGEAVADYQKAHELALKAVELDPKNRAARWLAAATKDRELMKLGKPQRYATQYRKVDGKWVLHDVDPSVTDDERDQWEVPTLAEARKRVDAMNAASAAAQGLRITYVANEGVLLEAGPTSIVIDGLHREYKEYAALPSPKRDAVETGAPPWNGVDVVLVSHRHADHFDPESVARFLAHAPDATLATSEEVVALLPAAARARARAVRWQVGRSETQTLAGVKITFLGLSHGDDPPAIQNLGHVIEIGGLTVLHVGDARATAENFAPFALPARGIDVALLPWWYLTDDASLAVVRAHIAPRRIVAIHIAPAEEWRVLPLLHARVPDAVPFVRMLEDQVRAP
jgi:L-ascorbate metabolism protein UlaG (beta-lactamase superfamily)